MRDKNEIKKIIEINDLDRIFMERAGRLRYLFIVSFLVIFIFLLIAGGIIGNVIVGMLLIGFYIALMWPFRYFRSALKSGRKNFHKTSIEKTRRLGIFDPEGVSIASRMLGAAFYLWVKDEDQESGLLRLRMVKRVYEGLKNRTSDNITLTYLTKGSFVMSVETDDFTWHAYDQSSWAKKYLEEEQAAGNHPSSDKQDEDETPKE